MKSNLTTLWGTAFETSPSEAVINFTTGKDVSHTKGYDYQLLPYDVWVNKAHVHMLAKQHLVTESEAGSLLKALAEIEVLVEKDEFFLDPAKEDVHTAIETWVIDKCGLEIGGKLHTARSRNDQVATDTRLYLRDTALNLAQSSLALADTLLELAQQHRTTLCPGYTHHQPAMVTTFGHVLLSYSTMMVRDAQRFLSWFDVHNSNPLGSMASYGTLLPIHRSCTTRALAFAQPTTSSLDPIVNRWEAESDLAFSLSVMMNHLSSLTETLILFSMPEFGFITLADQFSTGSSVMPQKKNPDPLEVIKGKTSYVAGTLQSLLGIGKAGFIGYNRDTQWTKYLIMDAINECLATPTIMADLIKTMTVHHKKMANRCHEHFIGTTSIVESLVSSGLLPLRQAKILVEKAITLSDNPHKVTFGGFEAAMKELKLVFTISEAELLHWQDPYYITTQSTAVGGPGLAGQQVATDTLLKEMSQLSKKILSYQAQISKYRHL